MADVKLLRVFLIAGLLVGPRAANNLLVEAVRRLMDAERDPSNPRDDLEKRLIEIIRNVPITTFSNPPGAEDIEEIQKLVKLKGDSLLLELFEDLREGFSVIDFAAEMHPEGISKNPEVVQRLRTILWEYLEKGGPSVRK